MQETGNVDISGNGVRHDVYVKKDLREVLNTNLTIDKAITWVGRYDVFQEFV